MVRVHEVDRRQRHEGRRTPFVTRKGIEDAPLAHESLPVSSSSLVLWWLQRVELLEGERIREGAEASDSRWGHGLLEFFAQDGKEVRRMRHQRHMVWRCQ